MQTWVKEELASVNLGDERLRKRLLKLLDQLSKDPQGSFNQACLKAADKKAAYRFFANAGVEPDPIMEAHFNSSWGRLARTEGRILVVQDTTSVDYSSHSRTQGLGPLESWHSRGFLVHSALALSEEGTPLGLLHQECWVRPPEETGKAKDRRGRSWPEKESYKWQRTVEMIAAGRIPKRSYIVIGDRESDVYSLFASTRPEGVELLVRSAQNRRVQEQQGCLHAVIASGPAAGKITVKVAGSPRRKERQAVCEVRYRPLTLLAPRHEQSSCGSVQVWVVAITEINAPKGVSPLSWILLATWPIESLAQATEAAGFYSLRWLVERYHYVLKSGCRIEAAQLRDWSRLERLEAVYAIIAWRLLAITYLARHHPQVPCEPMLSREEWQVLYAHYHGKPAGKAVAVPSMAQAVEWIAKMGGYWGRRGDAPPGVKVLWLGLQYLQGMVEGFRLASSFYKSEQERCG